MKLYIQFLLILLLGLSILFYRMIKLNHLKNTGMLKHVQGTDLPRKLKSVII